MKMVKTLWTWRWLGQKCHNQSLLTTNLLTELWYGHENPNIYCWCYDRVSEPFRFQNFLNGLSGYTPDPRLVILNPPCSKVMNRSYEHSKDNKPLDGLEKKNGMNRVEINIATLQQKTYFWSVHIQFIIPITEKLQKELSSWDVFIIILKWSSFRTSNMGLTIHTKYTIQLSQNNNHWIHAPLSSVNWFQFRKHCIGPI